MLAGEQGLRVAVGGVCVIIGTQALLDKIIAIMTPTMTRDLRCIFPPGKLYKFILLDILACYFCKIVADGYNLLYEAIL
jgi:hypothetical protein